MINRLSAQKEIQRLTQELEQAKTELQNYMDRETEPSKEECAKYLEQRKFNRSNEGLEIFNKAIEYLREDK